MKGGTGAAAWNFVGAGGDGADSVRANSDRFPFDAAEVHREQRTDSSKRRV